MENMENRPCYNKNIQYIEKSTIEIKNYNENIINLPEEEIIRIISQQMEQERMEKRKACKLKIIGIDKTLEVN
tara:strand:+ start:4723 stop:4941 length:219 start_codon:yes stop_codon:yes gene_type:complete